MTNASLFLALRYLQPKRSFVSVITLLSVLGVMLGVGVLIVVMSVMKGFERDFKNMLLGFEPHVLLVQDRAPPPAAIPLDPAPPQPQEELIEPPPFPSTKWQDVLSVVEKVPGVVSATPFVSGLSFIKTKGEPAPVEIYGMRAKGSEAMVKKLSEHFMPSMEGEPASTFDLEIDSIVISDQLANQYQLKIGDTIDIYSPGNLKAAVANAEKANQEKLTEEERKKLDEDTRVLVTPLPVVVTGILKGDETGFRAFIPLHVGQELFELAGRVHGIGLEIQDAMQADTFLGELMNAEVLPFDWSANSWMDRNWQRLSAVAQEKAMMFLVLALVSLVAAFSVANTTITVTVQKRREIGMLSSMGARVSQIVGIFVIQGLIVAFVGTLLGYIGGSLILFLRNDIREFIADVFGIRIFDQSIYQLPAIPSHTVPSDIFLICGTSIILCFFAALIPAYFAARVDPAVALRD
jgi:lipoprotein-releasing system permease protein